MQNKKTKFNLSAVVVALVLSLIGVWSWSQVPPRPNPVPVPRPIPRPPPERPTAPPNRATLGSSAEVVGRYSTQLDAMVKLALPTYDDQVLSNYFQVLQRKYIQGGPGAQIDAKVLGQLFLMDISRDGAGQTEKGSYNINSQTGRAQVTKDLFDPGLLGQEQARLIFKNVQSQHQEVLRRLAIGNDQVFSINTRLRYVETGKDLGQGRVEPEGAPRVEGFLTYLVRNLDGILVDGSEIKVFSHDDKNLAGLSMRWPRFMFHPQIKEFALKDKGQIFEEVLAHGRKVLNAKHEYNVKAAVVLRPVLVDNREFFIPALKIGMWSRPPGGGEKNIASGEAGEMFYVDLLKQALPYQEKNLGDQSEGN